MNPETRAFLDRVRGAEDPSAETEQRVLRAVQATISANVVAIAPASVAKSAKFGSLTTTLIKASAVGVVLVGVSIALMPGRKVEPAPSREATARVTASHVEVAAAVAPRDEAATDAGVRKRAADAERLEIQENAPRFPQTKLGYPVPSKAKTPPSDLRDELRLLAEVRAALQRGDGATALRKLDAHVSSDLQLRSERQVARALALCALKRTSEARRVAAELLREDPSSPHGAALSGTCVAEGREAD